MPEYMLLIYEDESGWEHTDERTFGEVLAAHRDFATKHHAAIRSGHALQPTPTATSIRRDGGGEPTITDGAFGEAKEALGGYYLIEAPDLDAALRIAKDIPAPFGGVEVRPIRVFE
jgi:hypothetical protein